MRILNLITIILNNKIGYIEEFVKNLEFIYGNINYEEKEYLYIIY